MMKVVIPITFCWRGPSIITTDLWLPVKIPTFRQLKSLFKKRLVLPFRHMYQQDIIKMEFQLASCWSLEGVEHAISTKIRVSSNLWIPVAIGREC